MKKLSLISLAVAAALAICPAALVGQTYDFTYSGGGITASGTLDVTSLGGGAYGILDGTITLVGAPIDGTGIILPDTNGAGNLFTTQNPPNAGGANYTSDNLFYPSLYPSLDGDGFNFELTTYTGPAGGIFGNVWGNSPGNYTFYSQGAENISPNGSFTTVLAPEGGAALLYLLLAGGACFGAMFFSRNRFANLASA